MFDGVIGYVFGGLVIGILARLLKPGADPMGWIMTILLGIVGAVIGGWASANFELGTVMTWVAAIASAIVLLFVFEMLRRKKPVRA